MKGTVLVTGGTGFVGGRLVRRLIDEGRTVRVLVRDPARLDPEAAPMLEIVRGDLGDGLAITRAVNGVDTILHLAALATAFDRDPDRYFRINARGLQGLLGAAQAEGVRRVVHVSTVAVTPPVRRPQVPGLPGRPTPYARSKMAAETLVQDYVRQGGQAVIVRPTRVYGPGPWNDANGTTRLAAMYLKGTFRFRLNDGGVRANYVHVDDVVEGILLAAEHGRSGCAYMLGGQNATLQEYLHLISRQTGVRRRVWAVEPQVMVPVANLCKLWGRLGGRTSLTPGWLNNFLEDRPADISDAVRDLGYRPRGLNEGLTETLAWLTSNKGERENEEPHSGTERRRNVRVRPRENWA